MLKFFRKKELAKKIIFWTLIIVLGLAFLLWGIGSYTRTPGTSKYAGVIFDRKVSISEFRKIRIACLNNARMRFGENYYKIAPYLNIDNEAWIRLVLLEHAKREQIRVSDKEVIEEITNTPFFFKDDQFNQETYKRILRYFLNTQPREYEEQIRQSLIIRKIYEQITEGVSITDEELLANYKDEFEELSINYIKLSVQDLKEQITIRDEEIKDYFEKNINQFRRPQTVRIEYIGIDFPEEAKEPEKKETFEQVKYLYPKIKNAKEIKTLAKDPFIYRETDFLAADEPLKEIGFQPAFYLHAFNLKEKEISPIIQTAAGVYVLGVIQKKEPYLPELDEVKEKVKNFLISNRAQKKTQDKIQDYKNKIDRYIKDNPSYNLKKCAGLLGIEVKTTPMFRRNSMPDIGISKEVIDAAFSLEAKQISNIVSTTEGYFLIEQDKFSGIDRQEFEKQKETYRQRIVEQKKQSLFNNFVNDLILKSNLKNYITLQKS